MRASIPISTTKIVALKGQFLASELPRITAQVARRELARVLAASRPPPPYDVYVDGAVNAPLESVKPGGQIVFKFNRFGEVLDWIYARLLERAPVKTGDYRDHIWLFVNSQHTDVVQGGAPIDVKLGAEVVLSDALPYARKIERGSSVQAPNGLFEITAMEARRRFPFASIGFGYAAIHEIADPGGGANRRRVIRQHRRHSGAQTGRFPAITVKVI